MQQSGLNYNSRYATSDMEGYNDLSSRQWEEKTHTPNWFSQFFLRKKVTNYKKRRGPLPSLKMAVNPRSEESYNLLNTQQGDAKARLDAYKNLANEVEQNTNPEEQDMLYDYVKGSEPTNLLLRGQKQKDMYPHNKKVKDEALHTSKHVSNAIEKNRIQKDMNVFRGIPDSKLGEILAQKGLTRAIKRNGTLDHKWIRDNLEKVQRDLINTTFADNGFTSTTTERSFANYWAQHKNQNENLQRLEPIENRSPEEEEEYNRFTEVSPEEKNVPGGHVIKMSLPAGSRSAFIGAAAKIQGKAPTIKQHEILVDKGSLFKITGFDVNNDEGAGPDSYNLMMELLSDEEGMEPTGNIAENLIQPNNGRIKKNLLDIRDYDDLSIDNDNESAANNLLEPIGDLDGEDLDIGNNDDDMKVGVQKHGNTELRKWKEKLKKKKKHRPELHELDI